VPYEVKLKGCLGERGGGGRKKTKKKGSPKKGSPKKGKGSGSSPRSIFYYFLASFLYLCQALEDSSTAGGRFQKKLFILFLISFFIY
jgi:hypothetical protein